MPADIQGVQVRRGEVWWARFEEQHPVVLLSDSLDCGTHYESGLRAVQIVAAAGVNVSGLGLEVTVATLAELDEALALADRTINAADAEHDEALSTLAAIRQSLRQGTMATRQVKRV